MATQDFKVLSWVTREAMAMLAADMAFLKCGDNKYQPQFDNRSYAVGDTIQVRRRNRSNSSATNGTLAAQAIIEKTYPLTIDRWFTNGFECTLREASLYMASKSDQQTFKARYIQPIVTQMITQANAYLAQKAEAQLYNFYGTPGTPLNTFAAVADMQARMRDLKMPVVSNDVYLLTNNSDDAKIKAALSNFYNPTFNQKIGEDYKMDRIADFWKTSSSEVVYHVAGSDAGKTGIKIRTVTTDGNSIALKGLTASTVGVIKAGDIISVKSTATGGSILAPFSFKDTAIKMSFVAAADVTSDASGFGTVTVNPVGDGIIVDSTNSWRNLAAQLPVDMDMEILASHNVGVAFTEGGLIYASPELAPLSTPTSYVMRDEEFGTGLSIRVSEGADITYGKNILRIEMLFGGLFAPEYCLRYVS